MASINIPLLKKQIEPALKGGPVAAAAIEKAQKLYDTAHDSFIRKVENSKISQEIANGPYSNNISKTIIGVSDANLFTFIGFHKGSEPISDLIAFLEEKTKLDISAAVFNINRFTYEFPILIPSFDDIRNEKSLQYPDDWNPGSWVLDMENHISGLLYYIRTRDKTGAIADVSSGKSRSGSAFQLKNATRYSAQFLPKEYVGTFLKEFRSKFRFRGQFT